MTTKFYLVMSVQKFESCITSDGGTLNWPNNPDAPKHFVAVFTSKRAALKWACGKFAVQEVRGVK